MFKKINTQKFKHTKLIQNKQNNTFMPTLSVLKKIKIKKENLSYFRIQ